MDSRKLIFFFKCIWVVAVRWDKVSYIRNLRQSISMLIKRFVMKCIHPVSSQQLKSKSSHHTRSQMIKYINFNYYYPAQNNLFRLFYVYPRLHSDVCDKSLPMRDFNLSLCVYEKRKCRNWTHIYFENFCRNISHANFNSFNFAAENNICTDDDDIRNAKRRIELVSFIIIIGKTQIKSTAAHQSNLQNIQNIMKIYHLFLQCHVEADDMRVIQEYIRLPFWRRCDKFKRRSEINWRF